MRARFAAQSIVLIALATIACVLAVALADRAGVRLDLTLAGEHSLAPQTRQLLGSLEEDVLVAVTMDAAALPREHRQQLNDLLDAFSRTSLRVETITINVGSAEAASRADRVLDVARERFAEIATAHRAAIAEMREALAESSTAARSVIDAVERLAASSASTFSAAQVSAQVFRDQLDRVGELPPPGDFADARRDAATGVLTAIAAAADRLTQTLRVTADQRALELANRAAVLRDRAAVAAEAGAGLDPNWAGQVEGALQQEQVVLAIGKHSVAAATFESLFETDASGGLVLTGERVLADAINAVSDDAPPIVRLLHGEEPWLLDEQRVPTPGARQQLSYLFGLLERRRIDAVEWCPAVDPLPPSLDAIENAPVRPVITVLLAAPSDATATDRLDALASAVRGIVERAEPLLATVHPSRLPGVGSGDPIAESLEPLGVRPRTGLLMVTQQSTPTGPRTAFDQTATPAPTPGDALAQAIAGLPVVVPRAVPIELAPDTGARAVVELEASERRWGETQWLGPITGQGPRPEPNIGRDWVDGPWPIVVASEANGARTVIVGGPLWFADRLVATGAAPGNAALLDASLTWLGGRDDLLAPNADARAVPRIPALSPSRRASVRWSLTLGVPVFVLLIGAAWRVVRG